MTANLYFQLHQEFHQLRSHQSDAEDPAIYPVGCVVRIYQRVPWSDSMACLRELWTLPA